MSNIHAIHVKAAEELDCFNWTILSLNFAK